MDVFSFLSFLEVWEGKAATIWDRVHGEFYCTGRVGWFLLSPTQRRLRTSSEQAMQQVSVGLGGSNVLSAEN